jgi:Ca2+-binding EF-hand superfamily protein
MGPGMMQGPQGRGFSAMDLDRDGVVTRQEFNARHRTMMDAFDANRDGYVSPDEFADAMPMWRQR